MKTIALAQWSLAVFCTLLVSSANAQDWRSYFGQTLPANSYNVMSVAFDKSCGHRSPQSNNEAQHAIDRDATPSNHNPNQCTHQG